VTALVSGCCIKLFWKIWCVIVEMVVSVVGCDDFGVEVLFVVDVVVDFGVYF